MNKKIAVIGTVGLPSRYGGFETLVDNITKLLSREFDFTIYCSSKLYSKKINYYNNCKLKYVSLNANGPQSIFYDGYSIFNAIKFADILLILGVSGCIFLPLVKLISKKKIIVNIDGIEWKRQKWNWFAKFFLKISEKIAVKFADYIIGDNKVIVDYVKSNFNKNANLISYGGDHVRKLKISDSIFLKYPFIKKPYAFKVCRIEPENNIEMIIEAFTSNIDMQLLIVGNWNNSNFGNNIRQKYISYKDIHLIDPIYDQDFLNQLRSNCHIYIHGHSAGGTNPSLVEAMNLSLPIFCYDINYNVETTVSSAKYFKTSKDLVDLLINTSEGDLNEVRKRMFKLANKKYRWSLISEKYKRLFNENFS